MPQNLSATNTAEKYLACSKTYDLGALIRMWFGVYKKLIYTPINSKYSFINKYEKYITWF